ncbi:MAG: site-specific DNA-methyltransferase [Bacteroidales bacterium]|nr:site-specific DNA-methyltransferase [Bacteroidales bacterium]
MIETKKTPAPRNRTLTMDECEFDTMQHRLLTLSELRQGSDFVDKTINADTLSVLPLLPDEFADLIIIDPPYNLSKDFGNNRFASMTDSDYTAYLMSWLPDVVAKLKPTGSLYICGDWRSTASLQQALSTQLHILNRITWQREKGRGASRNWKNCMEDIWFATKDANHYYFDVDAVKVRRKVIAPYRVNGTPKDWEVTTEGNYRTTCPSNFWDDISVPFWSMPENTDHPTQKPEKLIAKLILSSSKEGDVVFDPFLGSGTTSVVAKKLGRRYCGIEINTEYCCWAEKRIDMANVDKSIQGYSDGVFWERNSAPQPKKTFTLRQPTQTTIFDF